MLDLLQNMAIGTMFSSVIALTTDRQPLANMNLEKFMSFAKFIPSQTAIASKTSGSTMPP